MSRAPNDDKLRGNENENDISFRAFVAGASPLFRTTTMSQQDENQSQNCLPFVPSLRNTTGLQCSRRNPSQPLPSCANWFAVSNSRSVGCPHPDLRDLTLRVAVRFCGQSHWAGENSVAGHSSSLAVRPQDRLGCRLNTSAGKSSRER